MRIAAENNLLNGKIESWLGYAEARVSTAHDYSGDPNYCGEKAKAVLALAPDFLEDATRLYSTMSGQAWKA